MQDWKKEVSSVNPLKKWLTGNYTGDVSFKVLAEEHPVADAANKIFPARRFAIALVHRKSPFIILRRPEASNKPFTLLAKQIEINRPSHCQEYGCSSFRLGSIAWEEWQDFSMRLAGCEFVYEDVKLVFHVVDFSLKVCCLLILHSLDAHRIDKNESANEPLADGCDGVEGKVKAVGGKPRGKKRVRGEVWTEGNPDSQSD